jgi:hypothetical protein
MFVFLCVRSGFLVIIFISVRVKLHEQTLRTNLVFKEVVAGKKETK